MAILNVGRAAATGMVWPSGGHVPDRSIRIKKSWVSIWPRIDLVKLYLLNKSAGLSSNIRWVITCLPFMTTFALITHEGNQQTNGIVMVKSEFLVTNMGGVGYPWGRKFWPQRARTYTTSRFSMWWILREGGGVCRLIQLIDNGGPFPDSGTTWCLSWPVENLPYLRVKEL